MGENGMTPEMFQQLPPIKQGHFFKTLYKRVLEYKMQPGGQEKLDEMIRRREEQKEETA